MVYCDAATVLRNAAERTRADSRGPKAAVQTLWSSLHAGDVTTTGVVFRAIGDAAGVSDVTGYLGNVLRKMSPEERADLCERAAEGV